MKRIIATSCQLIILFSVFQIVGCLKSLQVHPRSDGLSVLYISRGDSIFSKHDIVKVFLNGKDIADLSYDGYKALHIRPGTYEIEFKTKDNGEDFETPVKFSEKIDPNTVRFCSIAFNFGAWRGPDELLDGEDVFIPSRFNFEGEVDLTGAVSPR